MPLLAADSSALRVMTFNIRYGTAKDGVNAWEKRHELCTGRISAFNPDILGVQESLQFQNEHILKLFPDFAQVGVGRDDGEKKGEFSPVFYRKSRFDLGESGTFWLSETPEKVGSRGWGTRLPRICSWGFLVDKSTQKKLLILNMHFDHESAVARLNGAQLVRKFAIEKAAGAPVIITGDFNAAPDSEPYAALWANGAEPLALTDAYRAANSAKPEANEGTFHGFSGHAKVRIDWIFTSSQIAVESAAIDREHQGEVYPSDHFPVGAVLRLK